MPLGKTGLEVTRLAQGTGVHGGNRQSDQTRAGFAELTALFRHAYDRGIRFFDLADLYGSHLYFREALRTMPRDEVKILTKVWWRYDGPEDARLDASTRRGPTPAGRRSSGSATKSPPTGSTSCCLHCCMSATWDQDLEPYRDVLSEAKEKKQVGVVGVSCHTLEALKTAAACPVGRGDPVADQSEGGVDGRARRTK